MSSHTYEIEIKALLGDKKSADDFVNRLVVADPKLQLKSESNQLNHYFLNGNFELLRSKIEDKIDSELVGKFDLIVTEGKNHSVRTRQKDDQIILVIKSSIDDTTSSNGTARIEIEAEFQDLTLEDLDQILLDCGFIYQAKWSRERQEYQFKNITVCLDHNAGFGYFAEFEVVASDSSEIEKIKTDLRNLMNDLNIEELDQNRLTRMFEFYNQNWTEYYGTDKVFTIL